MEIGLGTRARAVRAARNQALFRAVNEQLEQLAKAFQVVAATSEFTCECADAACIEQITLTLHEYEAVRAHANQFAIVPGHEEPDVEDVVEANDRFVTVKKVGEAAAVAEETYPRRSLA